MAPATDEPVLFPEPSGSGEKVVVLNARCRIEERECYRVVSICGLPLAHFAAGGGGASTGHLSAAPSAP